MNFDLFFDENEYIQDNDFSRFNRINESFDNIIENSNYNNTYTENPCSSNFLNLLEKQEFNSLNFEDNNKNSLKTQNTSEEKQKTIM